MPKPIRWGSLHSMLLKTKIIWNAIIIVLFNSAIVMIPLGCFYCSQQFKIMSKYNNHSESQESEVEEEDLHYKATTGYGHVAKVTRNPVRYESSSSEESELSEEDSKQEDGHNGSPGRDGRGGVKYKVEVESSEEESENSIDHIEERIKRLQKDLEKKLDRHKEVQVQEKDKAKENSQDKLNHFKNSASPPLPKKLEAKIVPAKLPNASEQPKIARNSKESNHEVEQQEAPLPPVKKQLRHNLQQIAEEPKQAKEGSPKKKKEKKEKQQESNNPSFLIEKKRGESKGNSAKPDQSQLQTYVKKLNKANAQIQELAKALQQSRKENKRLKQKLVHSAAKKKRSVEQIQKLKEITAETGQVKLQKEIQLLKIIEGLSSKLKKSINKKLNNRGNCTSAILLHKGLPSSLI